MTKSEASKILIYYWIAEYEDGTTLPQFEPSTGKENLFKDIDMKRLKRFGWHPFTVELAEKVVKRSRVLAVPTSLPSHTIELKKGDKLVAFRRNIVGFSLFTRRVLSRQTLYVLGVEGKPLQIIHEDGRKEVMTKWGS